MAKLFVALAAMLAVCAAQINNNGIDCGGVNGPIPDAADCSMFYECYNNHVAHKTCPYGLEFNPQTRQCDWPNLMTNTQCNRVATAVNGPCAGTTGVALIQHPAYCNGYMKCTHGLINNGCFFCGYGLYFDTSSQRCITSYNVDMPRVCNGKRVVSHADVTATMLESSCYPRNGDLYATLIAKIEAERRGRPQV